MSKEKTNEGAQEKIYVYGAGAWVTYFGLAWFGLASYLGVNYLASDLGRNGDASDYLLIFSASFLSLFFFGLYVSKVATKCAGRTRIYLSREQLVMPCGGWGGKIIVININDIESVRRYSLRFGEALEIRSKQGRRVSILSPLFVDLGEFDDFDARVLLYINTPKRRK